MSSGLAFGVTAVALFGGAVCSTLHQSLRGLSRSKFDTKVEGGSKGLQARACKILEDRTGHAASIALPRVFANIVVALGTLTWVNLIRGHPESSGIMPTDVLIAGVIATPLLWLVGYVLPLSIATHTGERMVIWFSPIIRGMHIATAPVRRVLMIMDEAVRRLAGAEESNGQEAIGAELVSMAEIGEAEGQLDEAERDMIEGVVSFRTTSVERIMTPRTEVEAIELTDDLDKVRSLVQECGHSRIPVYRESMDDIVGVLYAKDLLHWLGESRPDATFKLEKVVRKALFVPEQKAVLELLSELVTNKVHLAMVADEYGGTSGLVTIEDIIEEVFGEIRDEYDNEEDDEPSIKIDAANRTADADAAMRVDDANDELEPLGVEIPESDEYDTIGGFVVTTLGHIPEAGESIPLDSAVVKVVESGPTRVLRVSFEAKDEAPVATHVPDSAEETAEQQAPTDD
jgi:putative hemolysin